MDIAADIATEVFVLRYRVEGMDCPSCAGKIETGLGRLDGADDVRVNYQKQSLALRLDEARTPRAVVEARVRALGFGISPALDPLAAGAAAVPMGADVEDRVSARPWWHNGKIRRLLLIGVLLVAGYAVDRAVPGLRGWATLPAALLGLSAAVPQALILARSGSPFGIEMLMSVATIGALLIGAPAEGATVVFLFTAGEVMEGIAAGRARAGVSALTATVPRTAWLVEAEGVRPVPVAAVAVGQVVLVRPGDRVPVDGILVEGASALDESPVTGESVPVPRGEGDRLLAGSVNGTGALQVRATSLAADNTIARIIHMVEEAQASRAPTARFIERFSAAYTPVVVGAAALAAILPPLLFGADWSTWIYRGLALLLIGCPCALVLSTPAAITSGIAAGARRGLLIKGGAALEAIGRVKTVAFDKTGTLTEGAPRITDVRAFSGTERSVLALAASVETGSSHPLARAIMDRAVADGIPLRPVSQARAIPGHAAMATIAGKEVTVGSPRYAATEYGPLSAEVAGLVLALEADGKTVVLVLSGGEIKGIIALRDEPRADAAAAVRDLDRLGVRSVMLTGDNRRTAAAVGRALGLDVWSELLPEDKLRAISELKALAPVAMVGDGINDGPALAAASVGIAMGGGTDVALETADAVLLGGRVTEVPALVRLSRATMRNIHQNVGMALGLKAVFLVTTLAGITGLWPAILADTGATVIVTLNALRLLRHR
jgi:Cd2+/Zn2+-exporting ATPase